MYRPTVCKIMSGTHAFYRAANGHTDGHLQGNNEKKIVKFPWNALISGLTEIEFQSGLYA